MDPMDWVLCGSNDWGQTWTQLDSRTGETFSGHPQKSLHDPESRSLFDLRTANREDGERFDTGTGGFVSLAEFELQDSNGQNIAAIPPPC